MEFIIEVICIDPNMGMTDDQSSFFQSKEITKQIDLKIFENKAFLLKQDIDELFETILLQLNGAYEVKITAKNDKTTNTITIDFSNIIDFKRKLIHLYMDYQCAPQSQYRGMSYYIILQNMFVISNCKIIDEKTLEEFKLKGYYFDVAKLAIQQYARADTGNVNDDSGSQYWTQYNYLHKRFIKQNNDDNNEVQVQKCDLKSKRTERQSSSQKSSSFFLSNASVQCKNIDRQNKCC